MFMAVIEKKIIIIAQELLESVRKGVPDLELVGRLAGYHMEWLKKELVSDNEKKAFWINVYNIQFQLLSQQGLRNPQIFRKKLFTVAKMDLSLDDVEHGILRRNKWKYGLGYLPWTGSGIDKELMVSEMDPRIHFVLNCGAKSCPPIRILEPSVVGQQLDEACQGFLMGETELGKGQKELFVSRIFLWFLGDFGGKGVIRKMLEKELKRDLKGYKIKFRAFNWEKEMGKFKDV
jgi:hypothetical protein